LPLLGRDRIECIRPIRRRRDAQRFAQKHFAEDWWIMTLTTEIQANIDNMVAQAKEDDDE
jgi:hypothetical protein